MIKYFQVFAPTFYTLDRPKVPVVISMLCIGLNILFCLLFVEKWGFHILALGTSLSMCINVFCQSYILKKILSLKIDFFCNFRVLKIGLSGLLTYFITNWASHNYFDYSLGLASKIFYFCLIGIFGFLAYTSLLFFMGEFGELKKFIAKRVL